MLLLSQNIEQLSTLNMYGHSYDFKVIAFIKVKINLQEKFYYFVIDARKDLQDFVDRIIEPKFHKPGNSITAYNYRYTSFHKKVRGSKVFTMKGNPQYLITHSLNKGFFSKENSPNKFKLY